MGSNMKAREVPRTTSSEVGENSTIAPAVFTFYVLEHMPLEVIYCSVAASSRYLVYTPPGGLNVVNVLLVKPPTRRCEASKQRPNTA